jgi:hypothetical protein
MEQYKELIDVVEIARAGVQIRGSPLDNRVRERVCARRRVEWPNPTLAQILVHTTLLIENTHRRFEAVHDIASLGIVETLKIHTPKPINHADMSGFRYEDLVLDESPQRQQAVDAAGLVEIVPDAIDSDHQQISTSKRACFTASYRDRHRDDDIRIRSIWGSRFAADRPKPYSDRNITKPAGNE